MCNVESEVLNLNLLDLNRMKTEFYDCYEKLFDDQVEILRRTWLYKLTAMKSCRKQRRERRKLHLKNCNHSSNDDESLSSAFDL